MSFYTLEVKVEDVGDAEESIASVGPNIRACRVCLSSERKLFDLHEYKLVAIFEELVGMMVLRTDGLPQQVCGVCCALLRKAAAFRTKCRRAHSGLTNMRVIALTEDRINTIRETLSNLTPELIRTKPTIMQYLPYNDIELESGVHIEIKDETVDTVPSDNVKMELEEIEMAVEAGYRKDPLTGLVTRINEPDHKEIVENISLVEARYIKVETDDKILPKTTRNNKKGKIAEIEDVTIKHDDISKDSDSYDNSRDNSEDENYELPKGRHKKSSLDNSEDENYELPKRRRKINSLDNSENCGLPKKRHKTNSLDNSAGENDGLSKRRHKKTSLDISEDETYELPRKKPKRLKDKSDMTKQHHIDMKELTKEEQIAKLLVKKESARYINAKFRCDMCYRAFEKEDLLNSHTKSFHDSSLPLSCDVCQFRFGSRDKLAHHRRNTHLRAFTCALCGHGTTSKQLALKHSKLHSGAEVSRYKCPLCDETFLQSVGRTRHMRSAHARGGCHVCGDVFPPEQYVMHIGAHHKPALDFGCERCGLHFLSGEALTTHRDSAPGGDCQTGISACGQCGAAFGAGDLHRQHLREAHVQQCWRCEYQYVSTTDYRTHYREVHHTRLQLKHGLGGTNKPLLSAGVNSTKVLCDICGLKCPSPAELRKHTPVHNTALPHQCHVCPARFARDSYLTRHLKTHSEVRPYSCPECPSMFKLKASLMRHELKHKNIRRYPCSMCDRAFVRGTTLNVHFRAVHMNIRRHACPICDKRFTQSGTLNNHINSVHKHLPRKSGKARKKPAAAAKKKPAVKGKALAQTMDILSAGQKCPLLPTRALRRRRTFEATGRSEQQSSSEKKPEKLKGWEYNVSNSTTRRGQEGAGTKPKRQRKPRRKAKTSESEFEMIPEERAGCSGSMPGVLDLGPRPDDGAVKYEAQQ